MRTLLALVLINAVVPLCAYAQDQVVAVSAGPEGTAQLTLRDGSTITISKERGQVGISDARIAPDGTVGWLADFTTSPADEHSQSGMETCDYATIAQRGPKACLVEATGACAVWCRPQF